MDRSRRFHQTGLNGLNPYTFCRESGRDMTALMDLFERMIFCLGLMCFALILLLVLSIFMGWWKTVRRGVKVVRPRRPPPTYELKDEDVEEIVKDAAFSEKRKRKGK